MGKWDAELAVEKASTTRKTLQKRQVCLLLNKKGTPYTVAAWGRGNEGDFGAGFFTIYSYDIIDMDV